MDKTFSRYVVPRNIRDLLDSQDEAPRNRARRRRALREKTNR